MVRPPRFFTTFRHFETFRQAVQFLEYIFHFYAVAEMFCIDFRFELLFKAVADYKYHLSESCADGIVNGVIHDDFPVGAYAVHLFQSAVAAAHASGKN